MYHHRNIIFPFKPQTNLRSHTNTHADMYVLRLLLAATYLSTTKHPFDILVQLNNDEVPFAMVFADYILSINVKQKDRRINPKVYIIINRFS